MNVICREGEYGPDRTPVVSHVCDIPARLKRVSPGFFVMLNTRTQRYEIHDAAQRPSTLACSLPFDALDARAVEYARRYHVARLEETAREVEAHNERLEREAERRHFGEAADRLREAVNYLRDKPDTDALPRELTGSGAGGPDRTTKELIEP